MALLPALDLLQQRLPYAVEIGDLHRKTPSPGSQLESRAPVDAIAILIAIPLEHHRLDGQLTHLFTEKKRLMRLKSLGCWLMVEL